MHVNFIVLLYLCLFTTLHGTFFHASYLKASPYAKMDKKYQKKTIPFSLLKILKIKGGSDMLQSGKQIDEKEEVLQQGSSCTILVSTSVGSMFLDKKKRLTIARNGTIAELKHLIEKKFPGCPPTRLQRLFLGVRQLGDEELIGNITISSPTPILLDMLSGTSVYNKTLSISQALEAHAASIVQQAYLGTKLQSIFSEVSGTPVPSSSVNESTRTVIELESGLYRDMFDAVNKTLYETYAEDISEALEREKEPEMSTDDTVAWRGKQEDTKPLTAALAKEFDLNIRGIWNFFYYSVLLGVSKSMIDFKIVEELYSIIKSIDADLSFIISTIIFTSDICILRHYICCCYSILVASSTMSMDIQTSSVAISL